MKQVVFKRVFAGLLVVLMILSGLLGLLILRYPKKYLNEIDLAIYEFEVERELVQAVIWTESKFDETAKSKAGAIGLMQLMLDTANWCSEMLGGEPLNESDLYEPKINIRLGTFYLSYLLKRFDESDAIAAYNAGQGNVRKWLDMGLSAYPFKETKDYVERVKLARRIYELRN